MKFWNSRHAIPIDNCNVFSGLMICHHAARFSAMIPWSKARQDSFFARDTWQPRDGPHRLCANTDERNQTKTRAQNWTSHSLSHCFSPSFSVFFSSSLSFFFPPSLSLPHSLFLSLLSFLSFLSLSLSLSLSLRLQDSSSAWERRRELFYILSDLPRCNSMPVIFQILLAFPSKVPPSLLLCAP